MNNCVISLIQFDVRTAQVETNFGKAEMLISQAAKFKPDFIVLPEMWTTGFAYDDLSGISKAYYRDSLSFLSEQAKRTNSYIIGGSIPVEENENVYNASIVFDRKGNEIGRYKKTHLFSPTRENTHFKNGNEYPLIETEFGKIGIAICYDIRFPEIIRKQSLQGMKLLFVPAQFPAVRESHWHTILKTRAIENQIFVSGCNRIGKDKLQDYSGMSLIINPLGEVIDMAGSSETTINSKIDLSQIDYARNYIPVYKDINKDTDLI